MGGYETQKRDNLLFTLNVKHYSPNGLQSSQSIPVSAPQTTYSYRSKYRPPESDVNAEDIKLSRAYATGYDNGHTFSSKRVYAMSTGLTPFRRNNTASSGYYSVAPIVSEQFVTDISKANTLLPIPSFDSTLYGNRAIAATAPTKSTADLSTFFGEFLRDGLPSALGASFLSARSKTDYLRSLGGEYLNVQFGWTPLIKDLEKLLLVVRDSHKILEQYKRDAGRHVRRSMSFPDLLETKVITPTSTNNWVLNVGDPARGISDFSIMQTTRQEIWFKGAYTYTIPTGNSLLEKASRYAVYADKLLGLKLTPDRLWNLTPWSWLVDWHSEIGTALQARSLLSYDNQVLQYGYLMRKTTVTRTYTGKHQVVKNGPMVGQYSQLWVTNKERIRATPFGFGKKDSDLNLNQFAILGALGITLGDGQLRRHGY